RLDETRAHWSLQSDELMVSGAGGALATAARPGWTVEATSPFHPVDDESSSIVRGSTSAFHGIAFAMKKPPNCVGPGSSISVKVEWWRFTQNVRSVFVAPTPSVGPSLSAWRTTTPSDSRSDLAATTASVSMLHGLHQTPATERWMTL